MVTTAAVAATTANTGTVVDSSAISNFDFAICMVCAWLVPHLISSHRLFHRTLRHSPAWIERNVRVTQVARDAASFGYGNGDPALAAANQVVNRAMFHAVGISVLVYVATAILLSLMTRDMDYRTTYILVGISYFVGAFFIFLLSFKAPQWLAVYASLYEYQVQIDLGTDCPSLRRRVRLATFKTFLTVFPLTAPFFCGATPATIPVSIVIGLIMGFFLCLLIDWGNRIIKRPKELLAFALFVALAFILASAYLFSYGCSFVQDVWGDRKGQQITLLDTLSFISWIVGGVILHAMIWYLSYLTHHGQAPKTELLDSEIQAVKPRPRTFFGQSVYRMELSMRSHDVDMSRRSHDVSKRSRDLEERSATPATLGRTTPSEGYPLETSIRSQRPPARSFFRTPSEPEGFHIEEEYPHLPALPAPVPEGDEEEEEEDEEEVNDDDITPEPPRIPNMEDDDDNDEVMVEEDYNVPPVPEKDERLNQDRRQWHSQPTTSDEDNNDMEEEEEDSDYANQQDEDSRCHIVNEICCDLACGASAQTRSGAAKTYNCCSWLLWSIFFCASMFFIIVMVGSQYQESIVRDTLPYAEEILYTTINTGPQCAFYNEPVGINRNRTRRERVEATQTTFASPEEAHLAGYTILHCGACSKCSNWHDLRLEYATRNILGPVALECAKKTLGGGGFQVLLECVMEKTTFRKPCAECWAVDMECTKKHCMWIGIRSFMINTVTNLQVGADDITPATCEEAMCEATEITGYEGFVPCSGATRRRMDIVSTIQRPEHQQCQQVQVKWEEFFGPSEGNLDYDPSYDNIVDLFEDNSLESNNNQSDASVSNSNNQTFR
ncbi:expressed unknown protein [Seminavis robusta]|uniref:Uncharacterized protein n=1 Tax=Seminavis robusta TaxID=568900 RepID=A0A9N8ECK7_9STRA|nr:expressed unknown protein [Seminavis robusta]|eukprot:Sro892_g217010.1 n/a (836) ;mRNA; r:37677-40184